MSVPNPGSDEAVERGCTCPVIDNHYGSGVRWPGVRGRELNPAEQTLKLHDRLVFVFDTSCPLHGDGDWLDR